MQTANPTAFVTQADLAAMEKRYQDMLRDALAPFMLSSRLRPPLLRPRLPLPRP